MIIEIPQMHGRRFQTDKILPAYLTNDEPLFPLLMKMWLDQRLPISVEQDRLAA
jgi:hypothetical protein